MAGRTSSFHRKIMTQERIFYTDDWSIDVEKKFISLLIKEAKFGNFVVGGNNSIAIRRCMDQVNSELGTKFDFKFCKDRVNKLQRPYEVFTKILQISSVEYDREHNKMTYAQTIYGNILKMELLALAYTCNGEPEIESLGVLFKIFDDSIGWNDLEPIVQISTDLGGLSVSGTFEGGATSTSSTRTPDDGKKEWFLLEGDSSFR